MRERTLAIGIPLLLGLGASFGGQPHPTIAFWCYLMAGVATLCTVYTWPPIGRHLPQLRVEWPSKTAPVSGNGVAPNTEADQVADRLDLTEEAGRKRVLTTVAQKLVYPAGVHLQQVIDVIIVKELEKDTQPPAKALLRLLRVPDLNMYVGANRVYSPTTRPGGPIVSSVKWVEMLSAFLRDYQHVATVVYDCIGYVPGLPNSSEYIEWRNADRKLRDELATTVHIDGFATLKLPTALSQM
jgi:hypothetical protein